MNHFIDSNWVLFNFIHLTERERGHGLRVPAFEEAMVDGDARDDEDLGQARLHLQHDQERAR